MGTLELRLLQEVIKLREHHWDGLPPPPVLTAKKPKSSEEDQKPVPTSLGLPKGDDPERKVPQSPLPGSITLGPDTLPASPIVQPLSASTSTLSDFTSADSSDDESFDDPTAITPHDTFYLEDGNVEVLCGNTLFRVHTSILSFHSPALRRMVAQPTSASAESPNGCPRLSSRDTPRDFATLLEIIYLPKYVTVAIP